MGISRGRSVTVTENSRNGGFDPSVVIRNAVVPNHWIFAVPPRSTTALLSSEPIRRASRREKRKAPEYQTMKKAATTRTAMMPGSRSATKPEMQARAKGLRLRRKTFSAVRPSAGIGGRREPLEARLAGRQGGPLGPLLLRPLHGEHEDAHPVQRRGQPARLLGAARDPAHEFLRFHASAPVLRRGARGMEAPRDAGA